MPTSHNIVERNDLGVRDASSGGQGAQGREPLNHSIRELVTCDFLESASAAPEMRPSGGCAYEDNALELVGADEAVEVLVEELERLTEALALQALHHLGELAVCMVTSAGETRRRVLRAPTSKNVSAILLAQVELHPITARARLSQSGARGACFNAETRTRRNQTEWSPPRESP